MDIFSIITAVLALIISAFSIALSWKSLSWEKLSAKSATRSADAAEEANSLLARQIKEGTFGNPTEATETDVALELIHKEKARWVLRNVGTGTARRVRITGMPQGSLARNIPTSATLEPNQSRDLVLAGTWNAPLPNELWATWEGQTKPVALPLDT